MSINQLVSRQNVAQYPYCGKLFSNKKEQATTLSSKVMKEF